MKLPIPHTELAVLLGLLFLILEILHSSFIFFGFAIGAFFVALLYFIGFAPSTTTVMMSFTVTSVLAFLVLRKLLKGKDDTKIADKDINQY